MPDTPSSDYLRTDVRADVRQSLSLVSWSLDRAADDAAGWKWAIIGSHSALQGALVVLLAGGSPEGWLSQSSREAIKEWRYSQLEGGPKRRRPPEKIHSFRELLKRAQDKSAVSEFGGCPLDLSRVEARDLHRLNSFRNDMMHFRPMSWSIELAGLPRIVRTAVLQVQRVTTTHPSWTYRLETDELKGLNGRLRSISAALLRLGGEVLPFPMPEAMWLGEAPDNRFHS